MAIFYVMKLKILLALAITMPHTSCQKCTQRSYRYVCEFQLSAYPLAKYVYTQRLGEPLESCLNSLEKYFWSTGIYCPYIQFCGLGLDLKVDYRSRWDRNQFSPARKDQICFAILNTNEISCDEFRKQLHLVGLFSGDISFFF